MTLGRNLQRIRRAQGYTQRTLAAELDVDQLAVSRWERGVTTPNGRNLAGLAATLGVPIAELYAEPTEAAA